jgi:hypothetical protein
MMDSENREGAVTTGLKIPFALLPPSLLLFDLR